MKKYSRTRKVKSRKNRTRKMKAGMFRRKSKVAPYDDIPDSKISDLTKHKPKSRDTLKIKPILMNNKNTILNPGQRLQKGMSYYKVELKEGEEINEVENLMRDYQLNLADNSKIEDAESKISKISKIDNYDGKKCIGCIYIEINKEEIHDSNFDIPPDLIQRR